ncbi:MAG: DNA-3-methyladenine glycosylase [Parachlamydiales bacterium]|jgi:DNA-3-methyladenine glycosylase
MSVLGIDFYINNDVIDIGQKLLGKFLFTKIDNEPLTGGMIVETESYKGIEDKACHAYMNKRTNRNTVMYEQGGIAYVYICYGIHSLLNIVTNKKDIPDAVLIRAIEPIEGIATMLQRRSKSSLSRSLTAGPAALTYALNVTKKLNGISLNSDKIWIEDRGINISKDEIICSSRVGVEYAGEHAKLPWRFRIKESNWTSLAK